jgi:hypothetical protein
MGAEAVSPELTGTSAPPVRRNRNASMSGISVMFLYEMIDSGVSFCLGNAISSSPSRINPALRKGENNSEIDRSK